MKKPDVITLLKRTDKYYLGGANRLLWAPPFPLFLDMPGLWDKAHYYNYELQPLFTWTVLDEKGREIPFTFAGRRWTPASLVQEYSSREPGVKAIEEKFLLPSDIAACTVRLINTSKRTRKFHFVAWSVQEALPSQQMVWLSDVLHHDGILSFVKSVKPPGHPPLSFGVAFSIDRPIRSFGIYLSEGTSLLPVWKLTPFPESFVNGGLPNEVKLSGVTDEGLVYFALHTPVTLASRREQCVSILLAAAPNDDDAFSRIASARKERDLRVVSRTAWTEYFKAVPSFSCSDEFIARYYWYRWYGLHLNTIRGSEGNYAQPFVCEGIGYFRAPISYSAACHMLETRWMHSPELAQGSLLTFLDNQRSDGGFRGYIDLNHYRQEMFYHANWGRSLRELNAVHRSKDFLKDTYDGLKNYARYFDRERDEEVSGLYDIDNHYETGQEFMHRYTAVDPNADRDNWGEVFRLKGVDVTVYLYELKRALAATARDLELGEDAELWDLEAEKIRSAVLDRMWDPSEEMFFDIDPASGNRTSVKAATCFYPYFTDIVSADHISGLTRHLLNPNEFWTPYPVPATSASDETFSARAEWKGKRMNCPWNGRVWPMTNSHIAEALARTAIRFDDHALRKKATEFISGYIRMMFFDGDPERPNCFEHYNPMSGRPSEYRGIDDYQHSWIVDLIIKYVCGIRPAGNEVIFDPFPFGLEHVLIDDVIVTGRNLKVEILNKRFTVWIDGRKHAESTIGNAIVLDLA